MRNTYTDLLKMLEALRQELVTTTLDAQQAAELAGVIQAIEARVYGSESRAQSVADDHPERVSEPQPSSPRVQQHLIDELSREATALEVQDPDTVATVRTLISLLSNLGI